MKSNEGGLETDPLSLIGVSSISHSLLVPLNLQSRIKSKNSRSKKSLTKKISVASIGTQISDEEQSKQHLSQRRLHIPLSGRNESSGDENCNQTPRTEEMKSQLNNFQKYERYLILDYIQQQKLQQQPESTIVKEFRAGSVPSPVVVIKKRNNSSPKQISQPSSTVKLKKDTKVKVVDEIDIIPKRQQITIKANHLNKAGANIIVIPQIHNYYGGTPTGILPVNSKDKSSTRPVTQQNSRPMTPAKSISTGVHRDYSPSHLRALAKELVKQVPSIQHQFDFKVTGSSFYQPQAPQIQNNEVNSRLSKLFQQNNPLASKISVKSKQFLFKSNDNNQQQQLRTSQDIEKQIQSQKKLLPQIPQSKSTTQNHSNSMDNRKVPPPQTPGQVKWEKKQTQSCELIITSQQSTRRKEDFYGKATDKTQSRVVAQKGLNSSPPGNMVSFRGHKITPQKFRKIRAVNNRINLSNILNQQVVPSTQRNNVANTTQQTPRSISNLSITNLYDQARSQLESSLMVPSKRYSSLEEPESTGNNSLERIVLLSHVENENKVTQKKVKFAHPTTYQQPITKGMNVNSNVLDILGKKLAASLNKQRNRFYKRQIEYMLGDKKAFEDYPISKPPQQASNMKQGSFIPQSQKNKDTQGPFSTNRSTYKHQNSDLSAATAQNFFRRNPIYLNNYK